MSDTVLVEEIMTRPDAALQFQYFKEAMEEEQKRRLEFREWITPDVKAEFINGEVITHSPVMKRHWSISDLLSCLLSIYVSSKKLGRVGVEKVMIGLSRNDYEPDLVFFSTEKVAQFTENQVIFPAPDFVVEILSKGTEKKDRTIKKEDYALHGIREYWIIDPIKERIEQYILHGKDTKYFPAKVHQPTDDIESTVIKGFKIPVDAVFNEQINLATIRQLSNS